MLGDAGLRRYGSQPFEGVEAFLTKVDIAVAGDDVEACAFRRKLTAGAVFAGEKSCSEGAVGYKVDVMSVAPGDQFSSLLGLGEVIDVLAEV